MPRARSARSHHLEDPAGDIERNLARPLPDGAHLAVITSRSGAPALELIRHDAAHVLATAVTELYPGTKVSIGPPIDDGFYYDFEFPEGVTVGEGDFERIEAGMREHIKADERFERTDIPATEALKRFLEEDQPYKVELIEDLIRDQGVETVSLYRNGPFVDLCRGPHGPSTKRIKAFKLTSVAGAYWRGDETRQMLTRIYGTAFLSQEDLEEHLERLEQARARDHRKLGRELGLFMFSELSPGSPFWQPAGMPIWNELTGLWRDENERRGYKEVRTPILYDVELWKQSGHWDKYRDHMYFTDVEERAMGLKPMNCPAHIQIYKEERRSYRDLPIRYSEAGLVHRHEPSGVLHGLLRVRHITQDDAHIFCTDEQVEQEVVECLRFGFDMYELFGFEPRLELSTRPPHRFGLEYTGADNAEHRPVMIHRALLGSFERFIGILIEHYAGEFPLWLAPVQAVVLPIADRHLEYAGRVRDELAAAGLRVELDERTESVGKKIRDAEVRKVPYMLVVGDREQEAGRVSLRRHREGDVGAVEVSELAKDLAAEVAERRPPGAEKDQS